MKWFQHDTNASHDAKIKKLILRHGAEGYAVYFHCLELISGDITQNNITFELEHDAEIIADNLKISGDSNIAGVDKVNNILKTLINLELFNEVDNRVFCFKMANRLDNTVSRSPEINNIKQMLRSDNVVSTQKLLAEENRIHENTIEKNKTKKKKTFVPPSKEDIINYCKEKSYNIDIDYFYEYYTELNWHNKKGEKVKSWKLTLSTWNANNKRYDNISPVNNVNSQQVSPDIAEQMNAWK
jgi:hypothetical protein